jgi:hypothetical protein
MAFFSNSNIVETKHKTMAFTGKWLDSFGEPPVSGSWIIYGTSGSGKTGFALQLAKYLTNFSKVLYWTREQGNSKTFQSAWKREKMTDCGTDIMVADEETGFEMIAKTMKQRKGRNILIIDSLTPLKGQSFNIVAYERFRKRMKDKLLIWISHEKNGVPDTNVGDYILKLADLKIRCEGFKVMINSRSGEKIKELTIWEKGATDYWMYK